MSKHDNETRSDSAKKSRVKELSFSEFVYRTQSDRNQRFEQVKSLFDIARNDSTVATILEAWRSGCFVNFEQALVKLVICLQREKVGYMQKAVDATIREIKHGEIEVDA